MNNLIGNTPMIQIKYRFNNKIDYVDAKLEYYNLSGSIKDRVISYILEKAISSGELQQGMPIIEATSGNTGISIAAIGAYYKHPVYIFMPDFVSEERKKIMELYGAKVTTFSKEEGGFQKCIEEAKKKTLELRGYSTNQFDNYDNVLTHYFTTGKEIASKLPNIDYFVSGIGTGGTLIGTGKYLKELYGTKIIALEPSTMAILTNGIQTGHKIEGIGDDFIPSIVDQSIIDDVVLIHDEDAINMASKIARELGIGVGISSGANLLASILINHNNKVVTVFPDDNKKYLSTDLNQDYSQKNIVSNEIQLLGYEIL